MKAIHKIMWRIGAGCGAALLAAGCTTNAMHMEVSYDQLQFGAQDKLAVEFDGGELTANVGPEAGEET